MTKRPRNKRPKKTMWNPLNLLIIVISSLATVWGAHWVAQSVHAAEVAAAEQAAAEQAQAIRLQQEQQMLQAQFTEPVTRSTSSR